MSVMHDDFARYVIGTNASTTSSDWLALRLDEPVWTAPPRPEDQLRALVAQLSDDEQKAWEDFEVAESAFAAASQSFVREWLAQRKRDGKSVNYDALAADLEKASPPQLVELGATKKQAFASLEAVLTEEHAKRLGEIREAERNEREARNPPRFDLRQIQRFILKRVFDLGWTEERFGHFDRFIIRSNGREAAKAERMGKKYQWIAYHEILAFVSDRYQYHELLRNDGDRTYEGPWQIHNRDIDPSCTMKSLREGSSWEGHASAWWCPASYTAWCEPGNAREWVLNSDDLPKVEELLLVTHPSDGSRWLNAEAHFDWKEQPPADRKPMDVDHGQIWYNCTGYLLRSDDAQRFLSWAKGVDFWGRWMPEPAEVYWMFLGEHAWSPAYRHFQEHYRTDNGDDWIQPRNDCPVRLQPLAFEYLSESGSFDCSIEEGYTLRLPVAALVNGLGIRWSGHGADFVDSRGRIVAQDPRVRSDGPSGLLLREDILRGFLAREKLTIGWAVLGEKSVLGAGFGRHRPAVRMSGAYVLGEGGPVGFMKHSFDDPELDTPVDEALQDDGKQDVKAATPIVSS